MRSRILLILFATFFTHPDVYGQDVSGKAIEKAWPFPVSSVVLKPS